MNIKKSKQLVVKSRSILSVKAIINDMDTNKRVIDKYDNNKELTTNIITYGEITVDTKEKVYTDISKKGVDSRILNSKKLKIVY